MDKFSTLECSVLDGVTGEWKAVELNSSEPFPIRSEFFEGEGLVLVKTPECPEGDRYQKSIFGGGRRRLFEVQIRGRFVTKAPGALWIAGELHETPRMRLSALSRLAARASLAFLKAVIGDGLHYSFGDEDQAPHIATPLWSSLPIAFKGGSDYAIGDVCDPLESKEVKAKRRAAGPEGAAQLFLKNHDDNEVFTMSFNASNADMRTWSAKLPGFPTLDLHRLWGPSPLIVGLYALQGLDTYDTKKAHSFSKKRYLAAILLEHLPDGSSSSKKRNEITSSEEENNEELLSKKEEDESDVKKEDDDLFFDAVALNKADRSSGEESYATAVSDISTWDEDDVVSPSQNKPPRRPNLLKRFFLDAKRPAAQVEALAERCVAENANIDAATARCRGRLFAAVDSTGRRREFFIISTKSSETRFLRRKSRGIVATALASSAACAKVARDRGGPSRVSIGERRRRRVDASVAAISLVGGGDAAVLDWWLPSAEENPLVLDDDKWRAKILKGGDDFFSGADVVMAGPCIRSASSTTFYEDWLVLSRSEGLTFFFGGSRSFHVDLADVVGDATVVTFLSKKKRPMALQFPAFELATAERVIRVSVEAEGLCRKWLGLINAELRRIRAAPPWTPPFKEFEEEARRFSAKLVRDRLATPGDHEWLPRGRFILNARRLFDDNDTEENPFSDDDDENAVLRFGESLARRAGRLVDSARSFADNNNDNDTPFPRAWQDFVEATGQLRDIATPPKKVAFFLNIYHTLLAHAALLFGPPSKASRWAQHFGLLSYEIGGDVVSLAELEHCVIRNAMPRPKLLFSDATAFGVHLDLLRVATATSSSLASPYDFALHIDDLRLAFALNPGSISSCPSVVPVYDPQHLEVQLDAATRAAFAPAHLSAPAANSWALALPRKVAWLSMNINDVEPYLPQAIRAALAGTDHHSDVVIGWGNQPQRRSGPDRNVKIIFMPFDYACEAPRILDHHDAIKALDAYATQLARAHQRQEVLL